MSQEEKPIKVLSWNPVATWSFKSSDNTCSICREKLETLCVDCLNCNSKDNIECNVSQGNCGHCFHKHCVDLWLKDKSRTLCPVCTLPLQIKVKNMNNNEDWVKMCAKK